MSFIIDGVDLDTLNYTIKVPYNGSIMTGGDSLHADLNIFYDASSSDSQIKPYKTDETTH
jgi:Amt family ammonium transporter